jgi:hypothetical protein
MERCPTDKYELDSTIGVSGPYAGDMVFDVRDLVQRAIGGRNPFSNIGVRYTGSTDDAALNRDVARFAADPAAAAAVKADGDPTGVLPVPVVTIHTIGDPDAVVEQESAYRDVVRAATQNLFATISATSGNKKAHRSAQARKDNNKTARRALPRSGCKLY